MPEQVQHHSLKRPAASVSTPAIVKDNNFAPTTDLHADGDTLLVNMFDGNTRPINEYKRFAAGKLPKSRVSLKSSKPPLRKKTVM